MYSWLSPKLCVGGVSLPGASGLQSCSPCSPGQQLVNGVCEFCPSRQYSDSGMTSCVTCPASSAPQTGIVYRFWDNLPHSANLSTFCLPLHGQYHHHHTRVIISHQSSIITDMCTGTSLHWLCCLELSCADNAKWPRAGSGVVRIDPLRFLAGCRTRRLN